jgi:hypothetical protein
MITVRGHARAAGWDYLGRLGLSAGFRVLPADSARLCPNIRYPRYPRWLPAAALPLASGGRIDPGIVRWLDARNAASDANRAPRCGAQTAGVDPPLRTSTLPRQAYVAARQPA